MAKLVTEIKVTELEIVRDLINIIAKYYTDLPNEMQKDFDDWKDKLPGK